jgi:hypothetical protein
MVVKPSADHEDKPKALATSMCRLCWYWSGDRGNRASDLVCAVAIPDISPTELQRVGGRIAYAYHTCQDFKEDCELF